MARLSMQPLKMRVNLTPQPRLPRSKGLGHKSVLSPFASEAIWSMISRHEQRCILRERDDGDQIQRGPFSSRDHSAGCPLVSRLPLELSAGGRAEGRARG